MLKIPFSRLSTKALGDFAQRICNFIALLLTGILSDNPVAKVVLETNSRYQKIVIKKAFSGKGPDVAEQDNYRDKLYRSLRRMLRTFTTLPDVKKAHAASELLKAFDEAGSIDNLSYEDENTVMRKLMEILSTEENQAHITTVGLVTDFAALEKAQTDFEKIADAQTQENSELRQMDNASDVRHDLEEALRRFFALVSAMKNVPEWVDLYYDINELIKEVRPSSGKGKKGNDEPDKPVPEA